MNDLYAFNIHIYLSNGNSYFNIFSGNFGKILQIAAESKPGLTLLVQPIRKAPLLTERRPTFSGKKT